MRRRIAKLPPAPLAAAAIALALLTQLGLSQYTGVVPYTAAGFLFAVALLALATVSASERERRGVDASASPRPSGAARSLDIPWRWEIALVVAVLLLAAFFRLWRLLTFPPGLWYDEGVNAADAVSLIDHDHIRLWFNTVFGRSTLYLYLLAVSFKLFGYSLFAIRIVPAVAGLTAVAIFYPLARRFMPVAPALVATALFAVSRWAVVFSRISWEASIQPVLEVASIYFLIRGIDTRSKRAFALAGIAMAAGLYTYIAFRMVPVVVAVLLVYAAVSQWQAIRRNIPGLLLFSAAFLVAVMPLAVFAATHTDKFTERTRTVSVFREIDKEDSYDPLWSNLKKSVRMLNVEGDGNGRHNLPFRPMLDEVTAALVVLGLGVSLWSFRNWRRGMLAAWLVLSLVPGALTLQIENPSAIRGIGALPPIFLLAGLAASAAYRTVERSRRGTIAFGVVAVALIGWSAAINYHDVFQEMASDPGVYAGYTPEFTQVAEAVASHAGHDDVYVTRIYGAHNATGVLAHGKKFSWYDAGADLVFPPTGKDVYVVADASQLALAPSLTRLYPSIRRDDYVDQFGKSYFSRLTIPAADIAASHEVPLTVTQGGSSRTTTGRIDRDWSESDLTNGPIDATWDAYLWGTTQATAVSLQAHAPGSSITVELDGKPAPLNAAGLTAPLPFGVGEHHLRVHARIEQPGRVDLQQILPQTDTRNAADWAYGASLGDHGVRVVFHSGRDLGAQVIFQGHLPFLGGLTPLGDAAAIEMQGDLNVPTAGEYTFALDGATSAQLLVDDQLVVDNGGAHTRRHVEAPVSLEPGPHRLTLQYVVTSPPDVLVSMHAPAEANFTVIDGSQLTPPTGAFVPPALVTIASDDGWPAVSYPGFDEPRSVAVLPGAGVVAASANKLLFIDARGVAQRLVNVDAQGISDIVATPDGAIIALDSAARSLLFLDSSGAVTSRIDGAFASGSGIGLDPDAVYVASPVGGVIYRVSLADHSVTTLGISAGDASPRAAQPADVAVSARGDIYISDFEKRVILKTADGTHATAFAGVGGTGAQVPRLTAFGKLIIATDPTQSRIVVYDSAGKQRGAYNFPAGVVRPVGIQAAADGSSPDGTLYVADVSGFVRRLRLTIPPDLAAQLAALP